MEILNQSLSQEVEKARRKLDEHVREIVQWHFSPETGCPFWLEFASNLDFDPREEIGGYDDLKILGHFQDEWLRGGPVRRWVPKAYADEPIYVFETGGSTGVPKSRISIRDFQIDYEMFSNTLSEESFPRGSDWLMLGPTGPGDYVSPWSILPNTEVASVFSSTSTHDGSTNSSNTGSIRNWTPTKTTSSIRH